MQSVSARNSILREIISNSLAHRDYSSGYVAKMVIEKDRIFADTYKFTKLYSGGVPQFVEGDIFKTIIPLNETATMKSGPKSSDQVSDQVGNEAFLKKILEFCKTARTKKEISENIGYKNLFVCDKVLVQFPYRR